MISTNDTSVGARCARNVVLRALCAVMMVAAALMAASPAQAYADEYPHVRIKATVQESGVLEVTEARTFEFSDDGNGVYWNIPETQNEQGVPARATVTSVRVDSEGDAGSAPVFERVSSANKGDGGVYTVEHTDDGTMRLMIYEPHAEDEVQRVTVSYTLDGAVMAWADTAELYWQFVGPGWEEDSQDVELTVSFPSAASATERPELGENFRGWGHGPLDGSIAVDADPGAQVTYAAPAVPAGTYAEARIVFPCSWVPALESGGAASSEERLPTIVAEEGAWAREANERREAARRQRMVESVAMVAAAAVFAAVTTVIKLTHRSPVPTFADTYLDEVPSHDHPAVLAAFEGNGAVDERAFTSTLIKLTTEGVVGAEGAGRGEAASAMAADGPIIDADGYGDTLFGDGAGDDDASAEDARGARSRRYRLTLIDPARRDEAGIDGAALRLFFHSGRSTVSFDAMADYASDNPQRYTELLNDFKAEVTRALGERRLIASTGKTAAVASIITGSVIAIAALVVGVSEELWAAMGISIALAVVGMVQGCRLKRFTPEGAELRARCDAFKRWLEDYQKRSGAVPDDPARWNEVLMYAVALGLDTELVRALAQLVPTATVMAGGYYPLYWWYIPHGGRRTSPLDSAAANCPISAGALAGSSDSSAGGFGGGFSGGGGGGVGGGGGGSF